MANKLYIEGRDITDDVKNIEEFEIHIGYNENKTITRKATKTIVVIGDTYLYFEKFYFENCAYNDKSLNAVFKTDICGSISINLELTVEGMQYDPINKEISIYLKSRTSSDDAYAYLDSTTLFENGFASAYEIPVVYYADQPNWIQWAIILMTWTIRVIANYLDLLQQAICKVITLGFGRCNTFLSKRLFAKLDTWLTGLGRWSTAPLIREILEYHTGKAGISFVSSILKDPNSIYYNIALFVLERGIHGSYKDVSHSKRIEVLTGNNPIWTIIDLLQNLVKVFEGYDYRIIDRVLYFEKKEYFDKLTKIKIFDIQEKCPKNINYFYNIDEMIAYGEFTFTQDAFDQEGNKALDYYKTILEFNNPYSPAQKGKLIRQIPFSPARFMFDPLSYEITGYLDAEHMIDEFRDGPDNFFINYLFENEGLIRKYDLIITGNTLSIPKILILENKFNRNDALIIKKKYKTRLGKQYWLYNYPLLFQESKDSETEEGELIPGIPGALTEFAKTANPRGKKDIMQMTGFEIDCDCKAIGKILEEFQTIYIQTHKGKGVPEWINIKLSKNNVKIQISNLRILCN